MVSILQEIWSFNIFSTVECTVENVSQHFGIPMIQMSINPLICEIIVHLLCSNVPFLPLWNTPTPTQSEYSTLINLIVMKGSWSPFCCLMIAGVKEPLMSDCAESVQSTVFLSVVLFVWVLGDYWHLRSKVHQQSLAGFAWHPNYSSFSLIEIWWDKEREV